MRLCRITGREEHHFPPTYSSWLRYISDRKALESIGKVREQCTRVQRWLEYLSKFTYALEYLKVSATQAVPIFSLASCFPRQKQTRLGRIAKLFLIRASDQQYRPLYRTPRPSACRGSSWVAPNSCLLQSRFNPAALALVNF